MKLKKNFTIVELLVVVAVIVILSGILMPALQTAKERSRRAGCMSNLKQVGLSLRLYSLENQTYFPPLAGRAGFEVLRTSGYLEHEKLLCCPSTNHAETIVIDSDLRTQTISYSYASGLTDKCSTDSGLVRDNLANHEKYGNILFVGGQVIGFTGAFWHLNGGSSYFSY